jgi:hypothetical protein
MATPKKSTKATKKTAKATKATKKATKAAKAPMTQSTLSEDILSLVQELRDENRRLRQQVEAATTAQAHSQSQLAATQPKHGAVGMGLMVGVRSRADTVLGIKGEFGEKDMQLHPDTGPTATGTTAIISFAWWRVLRASEWVRKGLIERDDSVLGDTYMAAPPDEPGDLPAEYYCNLVRDPKAWIDSRSEDEIQADLAKMTAEESWQRLRGVVDRELVRLESQYARNTVKEQAIAAKAALKQLSGKYRLVDDLTTALIEKRDEMPQEFDQYAGPIRVW